MQPMNDDNEHEYISHAQDDGNYTMIPVQGGCQTLTASRGSNRRQNHDVHLERAFVVSVPTMFRQDIDNDDASTMTDAAESIYHPHNSIEPPDEVTQLVC
jgi:hypothetical protein